MIRLVKKQKEYWIYKENNLHLERLVPCVFRLTLGILLLLLAPTLKFPFGQFLGSVPRLLVLLTDELEVLLLLLLGILTLLLVPPEGPLLFEYILPGPELFAAALSACI
uniref:Uncharacterized protein n=1 Tax=Lepeophtheirus salmonis TaxID=72036 RepID=A0A0K2TB57_LEPSM